MAGPSVQHDNYTQHSKESSENTERSYVTTTLPSRPYTTVNIREVVIDEQQSNFVYNFFTPDERNRRSTRHTSKDYLTNDAAVNNFESQKSSMPRFNKIIFNHTPAINDPSSLSSALNIGTRHLIDNFIAGATDQTGETLLRVDRILSEGTFSNFFFNSSTLIDTQIDKRFYDFLDMAILFNERSTQDYQGASNVSNQQDRVNRYIDRTQASHSANNGRLDTTVVRQFISRLKSSSQGIHNENSEQAASDAYLSSVKRQSFLLGFNSTLIDDVIVASKDDSCTVFEDEIRALHEGNFPGPDALNTKKVQDNSRAVLGYDPQNNPYYIIGPDTFSDILDMGMLYDYEVGDDTLLSAGVDYTVVAPVIQHVGYVVHKSEKTSDSELIRHEPVFIGRQNIQEIIDPEVTYGHTYTYKLRSVSAVEYDFVVKNGGNGGQGKPGELQKVRGLFFIGSKVDTVKIKCIETIPPEPPSYLRFNYQRSQGLLVEWDNPPNPQGDIAGFLIYRRSSVNNPFQLIKEINFERSNLVGITSYTPTFRAEKGLDRFTTRYNAPRYYYLDTQFGNDSRYIYSVVAFDMHGLTSNYSPQYLVTYDRPTNKIVVRTVSKHSAPKAYPNMFFNTDGNISDLMLDNIKVSNKKRMTVFFNPEYYHIFKKVAFDEASQSVQTEDVRVIQCNPAHSAEGANGVQHSDCEPVYRIHLINPDLQKDNIVDICMSDASTAVIGIPKPMFEENNFSFELLHPDKYT